MSNSKPNKKAFTIFSPARSGLVLALLLALFLIGQAAPGGTALAGTPHRSPARSLAPELPNLAGVLVDGKWGYINAAGKFVLPPVYEEARPFSRAGVAIVKTAGPEGGWALLDELGKTVPLPGTPYAPVMGSSGLLAVEEQGQWSIADQAGNAVALSEAGGKISFAACFFAQPYCKVIRRDAAGESRESLVDASGREIIRPAYEQLNLPAGGSYLIATDTDKKDWLLSLQGEVLGGPFEYIAYAGQDSACVMQDGKFGLIALSNGRPGRFIIEPAFDEVISFQEDGLAAVEVDGLVGVIDRNGRFVLRPSFAIIQVLSDGGPWVASRDGEKFGMLDENGEFIEEPWFDDFFSLLPGGQAVFKSGEKWTFTSREGLALKALAFDIVGQSTPGGALTAVNLGGLWGFVDAQGELVVKPTFQNTTENNWSTETGGLKAARALNREAINWIRAGRPNPLTER